VRPGSVCHTCIRLSPCKHQNGARGISSYLGRRGQAAADGLARDCSRLRADGEYAQRKLDWLAAQVPALAKPGQPVVTSPPCLAAVPALGRPVPARRPAAPAALRDGRARQAEAAEERARDAELATAAALAAAAKKARPRSGNV
jgi:hypothetical protein